MKAFTLKKFDPELHRAIKIQAAKEGITIQELVDRALREYLERQEKKTKRGGEKS